MLDIFLTIIYLGCAIYAGYIGHKKFWIIVALMLALVFQYVLGFSVLAKITVAAIFVLYFVAPSFIKICCFKPQSEDSIGTSTSQKDSNPTISLPLKKIGSEWQKQPVG
jgi:uncharacterized membrane protein YhaH (DUF805 family)